MEKNNKESQKEKISKMVVKSLIDNYSMKTVIQNLYSKKKLNMMNYNLHYYVSKINLAYLI